MQCRNKWFSTHINFLIEFKYNFQKQKIVRVVFGIDIPKLIKEIRDEIELEKLFKEGKYERTFYDLDAPTPAELERDADEIKLREVSICQQNS